MERRSKRAAPDPGPGLFDEVPARPDRGDPAQSRPMDAQKAAGTKATRATSEPVTRGEVERPQPTRTKEAQAEPVTLSVSELTEGIKSALKGFGRIRVEGELSGVKRAASGHVYFDLKDESARISCVVWRSQVRRALSFDLEEGMSVVLHGRLDVYGPRGSYNLIVEKVELQGIGALLAKLEELKRELGALGWFERQRPLPTMPRCVGVVTSRDGAALRDFLRTRSLRWPGYPVRLCHANVQGPGSAPAIASAIEALDRSGVDVIVVTRGGGSLEDLWAFNERVVAEAIWRASVPVISGVGHETDVSLADFVADHRAHTPTDAAQRILPDRRALAEELERQGNFLLSAMDGLIERRSQSLARLAQRPVMQNADWILTDRGRSVAALGRRLELASGALIAAQKERLGQLARRLERESPRSRIERQGSRLAAAGTRLVAAGAQHLERFERRFELCRANLEARSPLKIMQRGYSLTRRAGEAAPLAASDVVAVGDELETILAKGSLRSSVIEVRPPAND